MAEHPTRNTVHWPRRLFHMLSGTLIVAIASTMESKKSIVLALVCITSVIILFELLRLVIPSLNSKIIRICGSIMRAGEELQISGVAHYCMGCTLAAIVFPRSIAFLSILYLAFGDPIASIAGVKWGKRYLLRQNLDAKKSMEGSLACLVFCAVLTFVMSFYFSTTVWLPFTDRIYFALLGGLGAAIGEILPLHTDDNLALPLIAGGFLWLTSTTFNLIPGLYF